MKSRYVGLLICVFYAITRALYIDADIPRWNLSHYTAFNIVSGFSEAPLHFASLLGIIFSFLGFVVLVYILFVRFYFSSVVPGFAFIAATISIFSGVQLLSLGVIGLYIARIFNKSIGRPAYCIRETCSHNLDIQ